MLLFGMIGLLIGIGMVVGGILLIKIFGNLYETPPLEMVGLVSTVFGSIIALIFLCFILSYPIMQNKATIINEHYSTEYTADDMFFAGSTIERMILGGKSQVELKMIE